LELERAILTTLYLIGEETPTCSRIFQNEFAMIIEFMSTLSDAKWIFTNIYAPCTL
jgi:hypothetical protein